MENNGAPGRIRTPDPLIRSQVLYPAELPVRMLSSMPDSEAAFNRILAVIASLFFNISAIPKYFYKRRF